MIIPNLLYIIEYQEIEQIKRSLMQKFMVSIQFCNENIYCLNPSISRQCCYHIKTSPLISRANQLADFYMVRILVVNDLTVGGLRKLYYVFLLPLFSVLEIIFFGYQIQLSNYQIQLLSIFTICIQFCSNYSRFK